MRTFHFVQPRRCFTPVWPDADQRSDAPLAAIAAFSRHNRAQRNMTFVFGGSAAQNDARLFGIQTAPHTPLCGHSIIGLGQLREFSSTLQSSDVLVGWGSQFRTVFDRIAPRSNAVVIDLVTGIPVVRSLMQSAWHALSALPARLDSAALPIPQGIDIQSRRDHITIGLCREQPSIEQVAAFTFAIGGVAVSGFEVHAVVARHVAGTRRMLRHTLEGGRLSALRTIDRPLPMAADCAHLWLFASTPKSGRVSSRDTDWATMLTADALAAQGRPVVAALPSAARIDPAIAPRTLFANADTLSDVAGFIHRWLQSHESESQPFHATNLISRLHDITCALSAQEPILNLEFKDSSDA